MKNESYEGMQQNEQGRWVSINDAAFEVASPDATGKGSGRRKNGERKDTAWAVTELQEKHHQIKRLLFLGRSNREIAALLDCSAQQVSNVKNSPIVKDQLMLMQAAADYGVIDIQREIEKLQPAALIILKEVIESGTIDGESISPNQRIKECNGIIDRHIGKATQNIRSQTVVAHLTSEEIIELKERALQASNG